VFSIAILAAAQPAHRHSKQQSGLQRADVAEAPEIPDRFGLQIPFDSPSRRKPMVRL
jgi:hypothetical protein